MLVERGHRHRPFVGVGRLERQHVKIATNGPHARALITFVAAQSSMRRQTLRPRAGAQAGDRFGHLGPRVRGQVVQNLLPFRPLVGIDAVLL